MKAEVEPGYITPSSPHTCPPWSLLPSKDTIVFSSLWFLELWRMSSSLLCLDSLSLVLMKSMPMTQIMTKLTKSRGCRNHRSKVFTKIGEVSTQSDMI